MYTVSIQPFIQKKKQPCTDSKLFSIDKLTDKLKYNKLKMMCVTMYMRWIITDKYECGSQLYNNCNTVNINSYETNNNILCINPNDTIYLQFNQMIYLELHHGILKVYVANCAPIKGISTPLFNAMISSGFKNQFKSSKMNFIKILTCQIRWYIHLYVKL